MFHRCGDRILRTDSRVTSSYNIKISDKHTVDNVSVICDRGLVSVFSAEGMKGSSGGYQLHVRSRDKHISGIYVDKGPAVSGSCAYAHYSFSKHVTVHDGFYLLLYAFRSLCRCCRYGHSRTKEGSYCLNIHKLFRLSVRK